MSPGYLAALKIPIERGRSLAETDAAPGHGPSQVVMSKELARQFWPGQDALGKTLQTGGGDIYEVVGVARSPRRDLLRQMRADSGSGTR